MISISGINNQKELELLPYFNKSQAGILIGKAGKNLDKKLERLKKIGYLRTFKKNMYVTDPFYQQTDKGKYIEYIANVLRSPSYLSLEYILAEQGLIPEGVFAITSVTSKSSRTFNTFLGTFIYQSIKDDFFTGFREETWDGKVIRRASKAKALFDFLYLKKLQDITAELKTDLRINWDAFSLEDYTEFQSYVTLPKSKKMLRIAKFINNFYVSQ